MGRFITPKSLTPTDVQSMVTVVKFKSTLNPYPAEKISFRSNMVDSYLINLITE